MWIIPGAGVGWPVVAVGDPAVLDVAAVSLGDGQRVTSEAPALSCWGWGWVLLPAFRGGKALFDGFLKRTEAPVSAGVVWLRVSRAVYKSVLRGSGTEGPSTTNTLFV